MTVTNVNEYINYCIGDGHLRTNSLRTCNSSRPHRNLDSFYEDLWRETKVDGHLHFYNAFTNCSRLYIWNGKRPSSELGLLTKLRQTLHRFRLYKYFISFSFGCKPGVQMPPLSETWRSIIVLPYGMESMVGLGQYREKDRPDSWRCLKK